MAAKTWYANNNLASVHQEMEDGVDPGTEAYASPVTGWVVSTGATNHSAFRAQTEQASTTFVDTAPPDGSIDTTNGDCLRSKATLNGSFASANWNVHFACRANTNGGAHDGRMRCRLFRSANADGSSATEITAAQQQGGLVTNLATSATQVSTATFNPGAFTVTNEYIFVQLGWERTGAGGMTSSDVNMRIGNGSGTGTRVISSDFTASENPVNIAAVINMAMTVTAAPTRARLVQAMIDMTSTVSATVLKVVMKPVAGVVNMAMSVSAVTQTQRVIQPVVNMAMSVSAVALKLTTKPVAAVVNMAMSIAAAVTVVLVASAPRDTNRRRRPHFRRG